jgi:D-3-phosphoglycerate dehydrogenase
MKTPIVYVALQQFCEADDTPRRLLREAGCEVRENPFGRRLLRQEVSRLLAEAEAVIAGVEPYDAKVLAALPTLQCISRCGVGTESIDLEAARRRGIAVYTTPDEVTEPVAQLTVALILALARHLPQHLDAARAGRWEKHAGVLLSEWTIGLIGFGRIGRAVERLLRPFSPRILAADPALTSGDVPDAVQCVELAALLAQADVVSLHASRPVDAGPLLGRHELSAMKRGSYLVNTARGHLVEEAALVDALQSGHLAGAALDVFAEEPYTGPLARFPQVIATPHVASLTRASRAAMERRCAQNVVDWLSRIPCLDRRS